VLFIIVCLFIWRRNVVLTVVASFAARAELRSACADGFLGHGEWELCVESERVVVDYYEVCSRAVSIEIESCERVSFRLRLRGKDEANGGYCSYVGASLAAAGPL
jgi:hypothetical protein